MSWWSPLYERVDSVLIGDIVDGSLPPATLFRRKAAWSSGLRSAARPCGRQFRIWSNAASSRSGGARALSSPSRGSRRTRAGGAGRPHARRIRHQKSGRPGDAQRALHGAFRDRAAAGKRSHGIAGRAASSQPILASRPRSPPSSTNLPVPGLFPSSLSAATCRAPPLFAIFRSASAVRLATYLPTSA